MSDGAERPASADGETLFEGGAPARLIGTVLDITDQAENALVGNGHLEPGVHALIERFAMEALASRMRAPIAS